MLRSMRLPFQCLISPFCHFQGLNCSQFGVPFITCSSSVNFHLLSQLLCHGNRAWWPYHRKESRIAFYFLCETYTQCHHIKHSDYSKCSDLMAPYSKVESSEAGFQNRPMKKGKGKREVCKVSGGPRTLPHAHVSTFKWKRC